MTAPIVAFSVWTAAAGAALVCGALVALIVVQVVYLYAVIAWGNWKAEGLGYYGLPLARRRRFKRVLGCHRLLLTPTIRLLSRSARFDFARASFSYQGVSGPKGSCRLESFRRAAEYVPRRGDVFVATQMRSGTTWMQHVVYQVLTRGEGDLVETGTALAAVSPWIESTRGVSLDEAPSLGVERPSRVIKTHLPVALCPFGPEARYVYVCRHPASVFASTVDFLADDLGPFRAPVEEVEAWFCSEERMWWNTWPVHVEGWWNWAQRRENVLFVTFEAMRCDLPAVVRRVAEFLDLRDLSPTEVDRIVHKCRFDYMREHAEAFEAYPPHVIQTRAKLFVSGKPDRHADVPPEVRQRLLTWCKPQMTAGNFPLADYYPDVAEA